VYVPDRVLTSADFKELLNTMHETAFMLGNLFICIDFTLQSRITTLIVEMVGREREAMVGREREAERKATRKSKKPWVVPLVSGAVFGFIIMMILL